MRGQRRQATEPHAVLPCPPRSHTARPCCRYCLQAPPETEQERQLKEEADIMRQVTQKAALKTYKELAKDIKYT